MCFTKLLSNSSDHLRSKCSIQVGRWCCAQVQKFNIDSYAQTNERTNERKCHISCCLYVVQRYFLNIVCMLTLTHKTKPFHSNAQEAPCEATDENENKTAFVPLCYRLSKSLSLSLFLTLYRAGRSIIGIV